MINKVKTAIEQYNMISGHDGVKVTVALSGGADSVALLHVLSELGYTVQACHVNHNLRGDESDNDEVFVRELCDELGVGLIVRSIDVKLLQKKHQSLEEAARIARYAFFDELRAECITPFMRVATAHTASDNSETVLLNLIRGTGLKGLCGIPPVRGHIIRPLILCDHFDIEEYCCEHNLSYVIDSTNYSEEFTRNKIRLSLMPIIKEINPSLDVCITRMCENLREDSDFLEHNAFDGVTSCDGELPVKKLKELEKPLLTRIIMKLLSNNNISPSKLKISQIIEILKLESGKVNLEKHKFAVIYDDTLKIETINQKYRK